MRRLQTPGGNGADALAWPRPHELLVATDWPLVSVDPATGRRKRAGHVGGNNGFDFAVDKRGDLVAAGCTGDPHAAEPVVVTTVATGRHTSIGGTTFDNCNPSLSPDGQYVVFDRDSGSGGTWTTPAGIWTAWTDGSHVAQLSANGATPLWSRHRDEIAYTFPDGGAGAWSQIDLIPSAGGTSTVLVPQGVVRMTENSWSADGKFIAFQNPKGGLSIVSLATKAVRALHTRGTVVNYAWSPDSGELLVADVAYNPSCSAIWRIRLNGGKTVRVVGQPSGSRRC